MAECISKYKKVLKKNLRCPRNTQKQLLQKFDVSLSRFLEENPSPSMDKLCTAFGSPKEMASILTEEVIPAEIARYRRKRYFFLGILGCIIAIVLSWGVLLAIEVYEINTAGISSIDDISSNDDVTIDDEVIVDDEIIVEDEIVIED